MKERIRVVIAIVLLASLSACAGLGQGDWRNAQPLPPSGDYADG